MHSTYYAFPFSIYRGLFQSLSFAEEGGGSSDGSQKAAKSDGSQKPDYSQMTIEDVPEGLRQDSINKGIGIENQKFQKKFDSKLSEMGIDIEEYEKFQTDKADLEKKKLADAGEFDKIKEQINKQHKTAIDTKDTVISGLMVTLEDKLIKSEILSACADVAYNPEQVALLTKPMFKLKEVDGNYIAFYEINGVEQVNGDGKLKTVSEVIKAYLADDKNANLLKAKGQGGSGNNGNSGFQQRKNSQGVLELTSQEGIAQGLDKRSRSKVFNDNLKPKGENQRA